MMSKNKIQFQKGYSLGELFADYGSEEACRSALFAWRWPNGFICPMCQSKACCRLKGRPLYQCNRCHHQTSLTSGTIFANTKLPLTTWFLAIHLVIQSKTGLSALALKRQLGVSYNTAWSMKHKIMQVMKERDADQKLSGFVQVDDVYWGGEQKAGKRGRGSSNKTPFVAAVSLNEDNHPVRMSLQVVDGFTKASVKQWAADRIEPGSTVVSDGLACFNAINMPNVNYISVVGSGPLSMNNETFQWLNTMIGNVKKSLHGAYHSVKARHLPRYLAEFCYRFNRRFELRELMPRFIYVALRTPPMPKQYLSMAESYG